MLNTALLLGLSIASLVCMFALNSVANAFRRIQKKETKKQQKILTSPFFYRKFHAKVFKDASFEGIFFATLASQNFIRLVTAVLSGMTLVAFPVSTLYTTVFAIVILLFLFIFGEFIPRILGSSFPQATIFLFGWLASLVVLITFPIFFPFFKIWQKVLRPLYVESNTKGDQEILDRIEEDGQSEGLEPQEKKIFESVASFKERIAREVMIPRVDTFFLPASTTIKEAALQLQKENYSRVPVYKNSVDEILGILLLRDILFKYIEFGEKTIEAPIETILRPVLFTPETKKISRLLQELRKKQMHIAIVVDEYGGTQGIVTIEDIIEEIVGEIEDEFDEEALLFKSIGDNLWLVDARMSIYDIEDQMGIIIPQDGDYDTIGGYLFHETGMIPPKGFTIQHDDFNLKVISSTDRHVSKVELKKNSPP